LSEYGPIVSLTCTAKSAIILTSATIDGGFTLDLSVDSEGLDQQQPSRVAVFELRDNIDHGDEELRVDKVAEWLVEGPNAGIGFCAGGDGK
jgi:hypothetical protein